MSNSKFRFWLLTTSLLSISSNIYATTLKDALVDAYNNNASLKSTREQIKTYDEQLAQSYSSYLPKINYKFTETRGKAAGPNQKFSSRPDSVIDNKGLNINQNLFNGGASLTAIETAKLQIKGGREVLKNAEQKVLDDTIDNYVEILQYKEEIEIAKNNIEKLEKTLAAVKDKFEVGLLTKTDVAMTETRLAEGKVSLNRAQSEYQIRLAKFRALTTKDAVDLEKPEFYFKDLESFEELLQVSMRKNPSLLKSKIDVLVAEQGINSAYAKLLPDIDLQANISRRDNEAGERAGKYDSKSIALTVTVPLFQGGAEYSQIRDNKNKAQAAKENYYQAEQDTISNVNQAWNGFINAKENVVFSIVAVDSAKIAYESMRQSYDEGLRTLTDLLQVERDLFTQQRQLIGSEANLIKAKYQLKMVMGELTAQDLELDTKYYNPDIYLNNNKFKFLGF